MRARKRVVTAIDRPAAWAPPRRGSRTGPATSGSPGRPAASASGAPYPSSWLAASDEPHPVPARLAEAAVDLTVDLGRGLLLRNPLLVASGAMGYGLEMDDRFDPEQVGAVVTRGTTRRQRSGNPPPRMTRTPGGLLNGVGLHNPGLEAVLDRHAEGWARWLAPVIVNLGGDSVGDFVELTRRLDGVPGVAGIELNLACPNLARGGTLFALEADAAGALTGAVRRATDLPLLVKLSPAAPDPRAVARAVADAGADAVSAVNTLPGLAIDPDTGRPALGPGYGGLSGPALRPVALRVVHEVASAISIPIVAMGGVTSLADVLAFLAAGAAAIGVATAAIGEPRLPGRLAGELADECRRRGLASHRPLVGTALPRRQVPPSSRGAEYRP
jgi:dihydroorotate dehydrogenase (NAD+) catalytic subunit